MRRGCDQQTPRLSSNRPAEFGYPIAVISKSTHQQRPQPRNVLGNPLQPCSNDPLTGFYRTGCCETGAEDAGRHVVCIVATAEFLEFSRQMGNDLSTPMPEYGFPGLEPGDRWCLCAIRWVEAYEAGMAPSVVLEASDESALELIALEKLEGFAVEP